MTAGQARGKIQKKKNDRAAFYARERLYASAQKKGEDLKPIIFLFTSIL